MKVTRPDANVTIAANEMKVGQCAEVAPGQPYSGEVILRHFVGFVSLQIPSNIWHESCPLKVIPIPVGEKIILEMDK